MNKSISFTDRSDIFLLKFFFINNPYKWANV